VLPPQVIQLRLPAGTGQEEKWCDC
jgi:hypothetical protein